MPALRLLTIAAALTTIAADPALAQRCLGLPMAGKNFLGAETRESWTGYRRQTPVYGGRYAHRFDAGHGVDVIGSIGGAGGHVRGDTAAVHASAMLSTSMAMPANLSICAGLGFEGRAVDYPGESRRDADAFGSIPVSVGLGYDMQLGPVRLTPFAAPTLAYYEFESDAFRNGRRQRGFDKYVTLGATGSISRFSVGASYRNGDRSLGQSGRFAFNTGVNF